MSGATGQPTNRRNGGGAAAPAPVAPATFEIARLEEVRAAHPDMLVCGIRPEGADGLLVATEVGALAVTLVFQGRAGQRIALRFAEPDELRRLEHGLRLAAHAFGHNLRRRLAPGFAAATALLLAAGAFLWSGRDGGDSALNPPTVPRPRDAIAR